MSDSNEVSFDRVVIHLDDIHRWMQQLQLVPGFEKNFRLKDVCSDISDTVDAARVELLLWDANREAEEIARNSRVFEIRLA